MCSSDLQKWLTIHYASKRFQGFINPYSSLRNTLHFLQMEDMRLSLSPIKLIILSQLLVSSNHADRAHLIQDKIEFILTFNSLAFVASSIFMVLVRVWQGVKMLELLLLLIPIVAFRVDIGRIRKCVESLI